MKYDVIVVGGGIGGLSAAALLAKRNQRVLVLERANRPGGRAMVVEQGGFTLNYGYHYILGGQNAPHRKLLELAGKPIRFNVSRIDHFFQYRHGLLHPLAVTARSQRLPFAGKLRYAWSSLKAVLSKPDPWMNVPLGMYLKRLCSDPAVIEYFLDFARAVFFTPNPEAVSAGRFLHLMKETARTYQNPSIFPVGTWKSIFSALEESIREAGGEIRAGCSADQVEFSGGEARGVWAGGSLLPARAVVIAVPPQQVGALLPGGLLAHRADSWRRLMPTAGVSLDLGVQGLNPGKLAAVDVPEDRLVVSCHSIWDPTMAPAGHHLLQGIQFLTGEEVQNRELVEQAKEKLLGTMDRFYPGATSRAVLKRFLVRPVLTSAFHSAGQEGDLLPVAVPGVANLCFVGDGTDAPGELSSVACNSAIRAAEMLSRSLATGGQTD